MKSSTQTSISFPYLVDQALASYNEKTLFFRLKRTTQPTNQIDMIRKYH